MVKVWLVFALMAFGFCGFTNSAIAGQSSAWVCVHFSESDDGPVCDSYELRVHITTGADAGRPGAFAIGARLTNGQMAYWTSTGGFEEFKSGLASPADGYYQSLPASRDYVVYRGSKKNICALSGGEGFDLFAGYGALSAEKEQQVNSLLQGTVAGPGVVEADHIRKVYIQMDATKGDGKGGVVYSKTCAVHPSD